jgi:hypothetical protein
MPLPLYQNDPGKVIRLSCNNYKTPAFKLLKSLPQKEGFFFKHYPWSDLTNKNTPPPEIVTKGE